MTLIVLLLFLTTLSRIQCGCPIKCKCSDNAVTCMSKSLKQVPYFESLTNSPIIIDLSGNTIDIVDIDDFSFDKSDQVKEIYLNASQVIYIEDKVFTELSSLQELYLADNLLNSVSENFIANNENMILLDLSSNYFVELPRIKSDSLEVLAIANSGISRVANDVLTGLPNLRVLLLQQNDLKSLNPVVFNGLSNFCFVRLAYNPWQCNCKTVQLFNYLTEKRFADITEVVQCQTENKVFIDIYNSKGVTMTFKQQCTDLPDLLDDDQDYIEDYSTETEEAVTADLEDMLKQIHLPPNPSSDVEYSSNKKCVKGKVVIDDIHFSNFYDLSLLCSAIVLSLVIGATIGSCITYRLLNRRMKQTQSWNKLLSKSDEYVA